MVGQTAVLESEEHDHDMNGLDLNGIEAVHELLNDMPGDELETVDILEIIQEQVKIAKQCKTPQVVQALMPLTGVLHFIKLWEKYYTHPKCCAPSTTASMVAAKQLGCGPSFACKLCELEPYILRHGRLPPPKKQACVEQKMLLNNEYIVQTLRNYLATLKVGEITPQQFTKHVNLMVLPFLGYHGKHASISEVTGKHWLQKLGYHCKEVKKGLYIDGHERPDVIAQRKSYLARLANFQL